jgi:GT2 family glycosyltransferase
VLVANSLSVSIHHTDVETLRPSSNTGFGGAVRHAVASFHAQNFLWDWLVIANDDIRLSHEAVARMVAILHEENPASASAVLFDPEPPRVVPGKLDVFLDLSLARPALRRLRSRPKHLAPAPDPTDSSTLKPGYYKSFSLVAISRSAWEATGGLSESLPFCYEDADFIRRLQLLEPAAVRSSPIPIGHEHSSSTRDVIDEILPVIAESARAYLETIGTRPVVAKAVVIAALVTRTIPATRGSANKRKHQTGIRRALTSQVMNRSPSLPDFERL